MTLKGQIKVTQLVKACISETVPARLLVIPLLLIMYRKPYIDVEMVPSDFTLDDLERSNEGHSTFKGVYLRNGAW